MLPTAAPTPQLRWRRTWLLALFIAATAIGSVEAFWRSQDHRPSITDSKELWAFWRNRVYRDDHRVVVFVGTSKILSAISSDVFAKRCSEFRFVQLGINGGESPVGTLLNLASDERFHGTIICDTLIPLLQRKRWNNQQEYYEYASDNISQAPVVIHALARDSLVVLDPILSIRAVLRRLWHFASLPQHRGTRMQFNRSVEMDFSTIRMFRAENWKKFQESRLKNAAKRYETEAPLSFPKILESFREIEQAIQTLQRRGGQVVFVQTPSSGGQLQLEEKHHPKEKYWDLLARHSNARWVHFQDLSVDSRFTCQDGTHLDVHEARKFTAALLEHLQISSSVP